MYHYACMDTVIRLPPYNPDLNPIELIWATVKNRVADRNITFTLDDAQRIAEEEFSNITPHDWKKRCDHVIKIETEYLEREDKVYAISEEFIINIGNDDTDSDSDSDVGDSESLPS
ncbi:unnamed protein product [Acanthoscelides obtectus]|uniref:Tc1-like transposase DDE domain-containing protein n=1 Tax=Acanthoscelides obtectus TaxID=200917 RepID=A0A9P0PTV4_ACAOB|nr:unnamed protein product [Acanthoscelides obtectus]CAK1656538.1 hypothetical protein AOBTE_LOCUS19786 [Acanthoscelides obtectus]